MHVGVRVHVGVHVGECMCVGVHVGVHVSFTPMHQAHSHTLMHTYHYHFLGDTKDASTDLVIYGAREEKLGSQDICDSGGQARDGRALLLRRRKGSEVFVEERHGEREDLLAHAHVHVGGAHLSSGTQGKQSSL